MSVGPGRGGSGRGKGRMGKGRWKRGGKTKMRETNSRPSRLHPVHRSRRRRHNDRAGDRGEAGAHEDRPGPVLAVREERVVGDDALLLGIDDRPVDMLVGAGGGGEGSPGFAGFAAFLRPLCAEGEVRG